MLEIHTIWTTIRAEITDLSEKEPMLSQIFYDSILRHEYLGDCLATILSSRLMCKHIEQTQLHQLFKSALDSDPSIIDAIKHDIAAIYTRDPAVDLLHIPLLYYKGFHALSAHRINHFLWNNGQKSMARYIQNKVSEAFAVDIHPAARIGQGILVDHATSLVIGETAVVGNNVSMLHEVTLGGTGKDCGDRHPKIGDDVLIGAGAKILGNIRIGNGAKIGAGSVVLDDVMAHTTVVGVPAMYVGQSVESQPSLEMQHNVSRDISSAGSTQRSNKDNDNKSTT